MTNAAPKGIERRWDEKAISVAKKRERACRRQVHEAKRSSLGVEGGGCAGDPVHGTHARAACIEQAVRAALAERSEGVAGGRGLRRIVVAHTGTTKTLLVAASLAATYSRSG